MTDLSAEARRLIASVGEADGPSLEHRRQMRTRFFLKLGAGIVAGSVNTVVTAGSAKAAASAAATAPLVAAPAVLTSSVSVGSVMSALLIGGALGVGIVVPAAYIQSKSAKAPRAISVPVSASVTHGRPQTPRLPRLPVTATPRSSAAVLPNGALPTLALPEPAPEPAPELEPEPRPTKTLSIESPAASPSAVTRASRLAEETELIKSAQRAIARANGNGALNIMQEYGQKFPHGALREESLALRVLALCLTGSIEAARAAAQSFVATAPSSPLLLRLERSCVSNVPGIAGKTSPASRSPTDPSP